MTVINDTGLSLAKRLRTARLLAELEQADVARALGVGRSTISNWETGVSEPPASAFVGWARVTGQPLEWFADGVEYTPRDLNPEPTD